MTDFLNQLLPDLDKVKVGMENMRLSALLCAVLDSHGGAVVIHPDVVERTYEGHGLQYDKLPGGGIKLTLVPPIRKGEV